LRVLVIPVSDDDRAKEFYRKLGKRRDQTPPGVVQFTPLDAFLIAVRGGDF
jgi:hypothetical protein